jgi:hypothetical protein
VPESELRKSIVKTSASEAENIIILIKRTCELRKSIIKTSAALNRKVLDDAFKAYENSLRKKPKAIQVVNGALKLSKKIRKERGLKMWKMLQMIGLSQKEVAHSIGVKAGYFSKVIDKDEKATLPEGTVRHLEELVKQKVKATVQHIFQMSGVPVVTVAACNGPSANVTGTSKKRLERRVINALASTMAGQPQKINLPKGVCGVTLRLGEEPNSLLVIAVRTADDKVDKLALAHEYDHLADHFRDKANEVRQKRSRSQAPGESPKKQFG